MTKSEKYQHPAFPQPESEDAPLWRYLDAWKFEWLLREGRLYMARSDQLGDPLEGTSPAGHYSWWREQEAKATSDADRVIVRSNEGFLASFRNTHYVSCWHAGGGESETMWEAYTSSPDSVAIRTTLALLKNDLPGFIEFGLVRYIDYRTADLPSLNIFQRITHKDLAFAFEQELRGVATRPAVLELGQAEFDGAHFEVEASPGVTVYAPPLNPIALLLEVVFHPDASQEFKARITTLCAENGLPAPRDSELTRTRS